MDKLENIKKIKKLLDDGVISEKEFIELKNEILSKPIETSTEVKSVNISTNELKSSENKTIEGENFVSPKGKSSILTINWLGAFFLVDLKTEIFINDTFHSKVSTKDGFKIIIPIDNTNIKLHFKIAFKNITYNLELDTTRNYLLNLKYDNLTGIYSENTDLQIENDTVEWHDNKRDFTKKNAEQAKPNYSKTETKTETKKKFNYQWFTIIVVCIIAFFFI